MQPLLIDTHAHIYLPEFEEDRDKMMERAVAAGVGSVYLPAIDSTTHKVMLQTESLYRGCHSMMGLHPCSVKENFEEELEIVSHYLTQRSFIAIGEIGLDFYWDKTYTVQQYAAFHSQIGLALERDLPIAVHSRNATDECITVVQQYPHLRGVFHCFSGNEKQARQLIELDFMLGIGGVVSFKNSGLDKVVQAVGLSHLILETDAPYLAPVPFRGKRNEPAYASLVAEKLSTLLQVDPGEIAKITTSNAKKLFGITGNP
jgi:TatD DNase family protein